MTTSTAASSPTMFDAAYIARHLNKPSGGGGSWTACCPAHDDRNPSLSISDAEPGKILVKCHAGCSQEAVIGALRSRGLWPQPASSGHPILEKVPTLEELLPGLKQKFPGDEKAEEKPPVKPRIVAAYDYQDEQGKLLYQVVRLDPKGFRQRRPDGNGGWMWNLKGTGRVLYRLPRVLAAKVVYIAEGEKDVKTLERLGRIATTNSGGAGKWLPDFSTTLEGKQVVIVPDNDEPGRHHAEFVARSVHAAGAQSVKVVTLPSGKDVTEWVESGGTKEQLIALVKAAPKYAPPQEPDDDQPIQSIADVRSIFSFGKQEAEFDVDEIILSRSITVIAAESGSGKSTLITALCSAVSRGEPFAGLETRKRPVLYLDRENPLFAVVERFKRLGITDSESFKIWGGWEREEPPSPLSDRVVGWVRTSNPKPLIIFDSLKAFSGGDENNASEMHAIMSQFRELANLGATVIVLHNRSEKSDATYRGSTVIKQDADVCFAMSNIGSDGKLGSLRLTPFKMRVMVSGISFTYTDAGFVEDETVPRPVRESDRFRDLLIANPGVTAERFERLAQDNNLRQAHARRFLKEGVQAGEIEKARGTKNTHHYRWTGDPGGI